jgi:choline kinase
MKAIIIAAGEGSRMGKLTQNIPKPLVMINGKSIIERQLSILKQNGILDIIIITGPHHEKFNFEKIKYIRDDNFLEHDQLGSLISAKKEISGDVILLFADIIFENSVITKILESNSDISIAVDMNWERTYASRPNSSFDDADKVRFEQGNLSRIFKTMTEEDKKFEIGEFIGLMKLSKNGSKQLVDCYEKIQDIHKGKFHDALSLKKAKLVDLLQELIENKIKIDAIPITGKWYEIDTEEDLEIAKKFVG